MPASPNLGINLLEQGQSRPDLVANEGFLVIDAECVRLDYGPLASRPATAPDTLYYLSTDNPRTLFGPNGAGGWVTLLVEGGGGGLGDHGHEGTGTGGTLARPRVTVGMAMSTLGAKPSPAPPAGQILLYFRSDGLLYKLTSADVESQVGGSGGSGHVIMDEGAALTARANLDFVGAGVTVTDNSGANKTVVTIPGPAGHVLQDEGVPLTTRASLNFTGGGVAATDDSGNNRTNVTVPEKAPLDAEYIVAAANATLTAERTLLSINQQGPLGSRPAANAVPAGTDYLATDDNGGTTYHSDGITWRPKGAPVNVSSSGTGHTIQDEGGALTQRASLDFQGSGVTVTDNAGGDKTIVTIPGSGTGGHTIRDEGSALTQRGSLDFVGAGVTVTDNAGSDKSVVTIPGPGTAGHTIQDEASSVTQRANLNFTGTGVSLTDDAVNGRTNVVIPGPPTAGHVIQDEGSALTHRANLDFVGTGVAVTDNGGANKTVVTISAGASVFGRDAVDGVVYPATAGDKIGGNDTADSALLDWLADKVLDILGKVIIRNGTELADGPTLRVGAAVEAQANWLDVLNNDGTLTAFIAGATNQFVTGTVNGDGGLRYTSRLLIGRPDLPWSVLIEANDTVNLKRLKTGTAAAAATVTDVLTGTLVVDPASLAAGGAQEYDVTVTGAALGDVVLATPNIALPNGLEMTQAVMQGANTVRFYYRNWTTAAIDLGSHTIRALVWKVA